MTPLKPTIPGKGLKRAIPRPIIGRNWVVEFDAYEVRIRERGRRKAFALPWEFIIKAAANREAERLMAERKKNRRRK